MSKPPKNPYDELAPESWEEAIQGVKPLAKRPPTPKLTVTTPRYDNIVEDLSEPKGPKVGPYRVDPTPAPAAPRPRDPNPPPRTAERFVIDSATSGRLSGATAALDDRTRRRLARGELAPTRRIDLHGYYVEEAWTAMAHFLDRAVADGHRCVLVIHGKGEGADGGMGVIKGHIGTWLSQSGHVLAYETAQPRDGGSGALYVLLRKPRETF
jgi:DNA-nicking Smr family endonuclease